MATVSGESQFQFPPFWHVVKRPDGKYVVVDTSAQPVPRRVYGPTNLDDAKQWAKSTSMLYLTVKGSLVTDNDRGY